MSITNGCPLLEQRYETLTRLLTGFLIKPCENLIRNCDRCYEANLLQPRSL